MDKTLLGIENNTKNFSLPKTKTKTTILEKLKTYTVKGIDEGKNITDSFISNNSDTNLMNSLNNSNDNVNNNLIFKIFRYILAILLLIFVVVNVLAALDLLGDYLKKKLRPMLIFFNHSVEKTIEDTKSNTATGAQTILDTLEQDINLKNNNDLDNLPLANDSIDNILNEKDRNQLGYCYVGTDRGHRSCIEVEDTDNCMSGDVFPTLDICINPNLRQ